MTYKGSTYLDAGLGAIHKGRPHKSTIFYPLPPPCPHLSTFGIPLPPIGRPQCLFILKKFHWNCYVIFKYNFSKLASFYTAF